MIVDTKELCDKIDVFETIKTTTTLIITEKCNYKCSCCFLNESSSIINTDIIDAAITNCKNVINGNLLSLSGGEPTLEIDLCEYAIRKAQKNSLKTRIITNGWWGINDELLERIYNFDLDYLYLSIDSFHNSDFEAIKNIINKFKNHIKTNVICLTLDRNENFIKRFKDELNIFIYEEVFFNNKNGFMDYDPLKNNGFCINKGFKIYPNGDCYVNCYLGKNACKVGNVLSDGQYLLKEFFKNYMDIYPMWLGEPGLSHCFKIKNALFTSNKSYNTLRHRLVSDLGPSYKEVLNSLGIGEIAEIVS